MYPLPLKDTHDIRPRQSGMKRPGATFRRKLLEPSPPAPNALALCLNKQDPNNDRRQHYKNVPKAAVGLRRIREEGVRQHATKPIMRRRRRSWRRKIWFARRRLLHRNARLRLFGARQRTGTGLGNRRYIWIAGQRLLRQSAGLRLLRAWQPVENGPGRGRRLSWAARAALKGGLRGLSIAMFVRLALDGTAQSDFYTPRLSLEMAARRGKE